MNLNLTQPALGRGRGDSEKGFRFKTFTVSQTGIPSRTFFKTLKRYNLAFRSSGGQGRVV